MEVQIKRKRIKIDPDFGRLISNKTGAKFFRCYQCQKCAAGCPVIKAMDWPPNKLLRMVQLGLKEEVLKSATIWVCAACVTCATRCPNDIDIVRVMDELREIALREGVKGKRKAIPTFHRLFLSLIRHWGRLNELYLIGLLKMVTGNLFSDLDLGLKLFQKGKLSILPEKIKGIEEIKKIYKKISEKGQIQK